MRLVICLCAFLALTNHVHAAVPPAAKAQSAQALTDYVTQFLRQQFHATLQVRVDAPKTRDLTACQRLQAVKPQRLRPRTTVHVRCLAPQPWHLHVQTHLRLPGVYFATTRTLAPSEIVQKNDIRAIQADLLSLPADTLTDAQQALGHITTQRIPKNSAIKSGVLRDAQSIQRGQRVYTQVQGTGFIMRGTAQAMQNGTPGSTIQVRTASGKLLSAIVVDANTVQVPL